MSQSMPLKSAHRMVTAVVLGLAMLCGLLPSGCGYGVINNPKPFGMTTIVLEPFAENIPLGLSPVLARLIAHELRSQGIIIAPQSTSTSGTLRGRVTASRTATSPVAAIDASVDAYKIYVTIDVSLRDNANETLWKASLNDNEDFLQADGSAPARTLGDSTLATEANRRRAVLRIAQRMAKELRSRLTIASFTASSREEP